MESARINNRGSARIFKNSMLEALTKTRPWVIYAIYIPVCLYLLYYSYAEVRLPLTRIGGIFLLALFSWTLFEYVAHRYLFHYQPTSKLGQRIIYIFHGNHHEFPRDKDRLFMPPVPSVVFAAIIWCIIFSISYLVFGTGVYVYAFFPGFMIGYLLYVSMHYAIHAFPPPKGMKALWRNHNLHHYKDPEKGFGVSSSLWDKIFGTVPEKENTLK